MICVHIPLASTAVKYYTHWYFSRLEQDNKKIILLILWRNKHWDLVLYHSSDTKKVQQNGQTKIVNTRTIGKDYSVSLKKIYKHHKKLFAI